MKIKKYLNAFAAIIILLTMVSCNSSSSSSSSTTSNSSSIEVKEVVFVNEMDYIYGLMYAEEYNGLYGICSFCSINLLDSDYDDKLDSCFHIVGDKILITSNNNTVIGDASYPERITFHGEIYSYEYQRAKVLKIEDSKIDRDIYGNIVHIAGYEMLEYVILNETFKGYSKCSMPKYVRLSSYCGEVYASYYNDKPVALYSFNPLEGN